MVHCNNFRICYQLLHDLHSCDLYEVFVELINGYEKNLSAVFPSRDQNRKYFQCTLQRKVNEVRKVVSFSPEKHKLLSNIQAKNIN